jgi:hypothetical protein
VTLVYPSRHKFAAEDGPLVEDGVLTTLTEGPTTVSEFLSAVKISQGACDAITEFMQTAIERTYQGWT